MGAADAQAIAKQQALVSEKRERKACKFTPLGCR